MFVYFFALCFMYLIQKSYLSTQNTYQQKIKIGVVQVGLYYQLGGNTTDFLSDLLNFV
ncbi:aatD, apolipoN-acyltransferase domain protein, partial [Escherichia coli p0305293.6]